jgi:hypothetical protein
MMSRMSVRPDMASRRLPTLATGLMTLLLGIPAGTAQSPPARPASAPAAAAPAAASGTYSVEVIVFRSAGGGDGGTAAPPRGGGDTSGNTQVARYIGPLPGSRMQLGGAREKLARGGYRVLAHTGWVQTAGSWGSRSGLSLDRLGIRVPGLSGSFMLERGSLLHLGMNLRYAGDGGPSAQINEIRRIRFNERNYYDHPSLGVIAVVTPGG